MGIRQPYGQVDKEHGSLSELQLCGRAMNLFALGAGEVGRASIELQPYGRSNEAGAIVSLIDY